MVPRVLASLRRWREKKTVKISTFDNLAASLQCIRSVHLAGLGLGCARARGARADHREGRACARAGGSQRWRATGEGNGALGRLILLPDPLVCYRGQQILARQRDLLGKN